MPNALKTKPKRSRHDLILDAAALHLANSGVSTSLLPEIAASMGLVRSALYYYVRAKEDLVFQVYMRSTNILAETAEAIRSGPGTAPDKLVDFLKSITCRDEIDVIALSEVGMLGAQQQASVLSHYEASVAAIAGIINQGATSGELRSCDSEIVARTIISTIQHLCMIRAWTQQHSSVSPLGEQDVDFPRLIEGSVDLLLNGWAANRRRVIPLELMDFAALRSKPARAFDRQGLACAKHNEILVTASRLFNQRGVSSTTLDDIAGALGVTKRTLYHHVGDKQALLSACHERAQLIIKRLYAEYNQRLANGEDCEVAHLNYLRSAVLSNLLPDIAPIRAAIGIAELTEEDRQAHRDYLQFLFELAIAQRGALQSCGAVRKHNGKTANLLHMGSVNWLANGSVSIEPSRMTDVACEVVDVLRLGLLPLA